ncbi:hypothetical protein CVT25_005536 [Psilocybe cyanescens]|uniref:Uncharacterized protein n=1 Tax=Psilocybe cyanescens TaxID=93625 RepID=A0A409VR00_PSICY|nr:hypothetical protein CVT25_005536 [Psilocybe cyanescens]
MSTIGGNASLFIKEAAVRWYMMLDMRGSSSFGHSMRTRLELKEVSIEPSPDDSKKMSSKMVCDLEITPVSFEILRGSAISLLLMRLLEDENEVIGVTQTFNFFFHHPAPPAGSRIRIINRSVSTAEDVGCCQSEVGLHLLGRGHI